MMRELADNILDIAQNSISAGSTLTEITVCVSHEKNLVSLTFKDNGCGMPPEFVKAVTEPFTTTRKTRRIGLGLPLLHMTANMTGGEFHIESEVGKGTCVSVSFGLDHIDRPPLGDVAGSWFTLVFMNPELDFLLVYEVDGERFEFDTRLVRETVAPIPLSEPEIAAWIRECISQEITQLHGGTFQ